MKKLFIITVVLAATLAAGNAQAGIFGWRRGYAQPQPAPVAAPVTTARAENGYRAFSYQPAPAVTYAAPMRRATTDQAFHDAGWKVRGF
jgi:hypothetical protein